MTILHLWGLSDMCQYYGHKKLTFNMKLCLFLLLLLVMKETFYKIYVIAEKGICLMQYNFDEYINRRQKNSVDLHFILSRCKLKKKDNT